MRFELIRFASFLHPGEVGEVGLEPTPSAFKALRPAFRLFPIKCDPWDSNPQATGSKPARYANSLQSRIKSGMLDSNQRSPASKAGRDDQTPLMPVSRDGEIRTHGPSDPNGVRYQTAPHPD